VGEELVRRPLGAAAGDETVIVHQDDPARDDAGVEKSKRVQGGLAQILVDVNNAEFAIRHFVEAFGIQPLKTR